jgi:hypothetical protein
MTMSRITQFSASTVEAIKSYVYVLTDENDRVFYVGKGLGNRVFSHVNEVRDLLATGAAISDESVEADDAENPVRPESMGPKRQQIADMLRQGKEPGMYIVRDNLTHDEALLIEAVLIDIVDWQLDGKLTNAVSGHGASAFGLKSVAELEATKGRPFNVRDLPGIDSVKEVIAINVNRRYAEVESRKATLLDIAKGSWKLGVNRARNCPYAVIHARGIVRGVFRLQGWMESKEMPGRYEFIPDGAESLAGEAFSNRNVDDMFVGSRIGSQNPIRYIPVAATKA